MYVEDHTGDSANRESGTKLTNSMKKDIKIRADFRAFLKNFEVRLP